MRQYSWRLNGKFWCSTWNTLFDNEKQTKWEVKPFHWWNAQWQSEWFCVHMSPMFCNPSCDLRSALFSLEDFFTWSVSSLAKFFQSSVTNPLRYIFKHMKVEVYQSKSLTSKLQRNSGNLQDVLSCNVSIRWVAESKL